MSDATILPVPAEWAAIRQFELPPAFGRIAPRAEEALVGRVRNNVELQIVRPPQNVLRHGT